MYITMNVITNTKKEATGFYSFVGKHFVWVHEVASDSVNKCTLQIYIYITKLLPQERFLAYTNPMLSSTCSTKFNCFVCKRRRKRFHSLNLILIT
eukprot:m.52127 g.52127  ORF g.52127 m.52127 type:complete len:95 (-) comp7603_c0_seq1:1527-1811(-)